MLDYIIIGAGLSGIAVSELLINKGGKIKVLGLFACLVGGFVFIRNRRGGGTPPFVLYFRWFPPHATN